MSLYNELKLYVQHDFHDRECKEWWGARSGDNRGRVQCPDKVIWSAPQAVMMLVHRRYLERGEVVLHLCNNPICVNPRHLRLGSQAENMQQMVREKRTYHDKVHGSEMKRLWSRVYKGSGVDCWYWRNQANYDPQVFINNRAIRVKRFMAQFMLERELIPNERVFLSCADSHCVNPHHMFIRNNVCNEVDEVTCRSNYEAARRLAKQGGGRSLGNYLGEKVSGYQIRFTRVQVEKLLATR